MVNTGDREHLERRHGRAPFVHLDSIRTALFLLSIQTRPAWLFVRSFAKGVDRGSTHSLAASASEGLSHTSASYSSLSPVRLYCRSGAGEIVATASWLSFPLEGATRPDGTRAASLALTSLNTNGPAVMPGHWLHMSCSSSGFGCSLRSTFEPAEEVLERRRWLAWTFHGYPRSLGRSRANFSA